LEDFFAELSYYGILTSEDAQCFRSDIGVEPTFYILFTAAVVLAAVTSFVVKAVTHYFRDMDPHQNPFLGVNAIKDVESASDDLDDNISEDISTIRPVPVLFTDRYRWFLHRETAYDESNPAFKGKSQEIFEQNTGPTLGVSYEVNNVPESHDKVRDECHIINDVADCDESDVYINEIPASQPLNNNSHAMGDSGNVSPPALPSGIIVVNGVAGAAVRRGYDVDEDWVEESHPVSDVTENCQQDTDTFSCDGAALLLNQTIATGGVSRNMQSDNHLKSIVIDDNCCEDPTDDEEENVNKQATSIDFEADHVDAELDNADSEGGKIDNSNADIVMNETNTMEVDVAENEKKEATSIDFEVGNVDAKSDNAIGDGGKIYNNTADIVTNETDSMVVESNTPVSPSSIQNGLQSFEASEAIPDIQTFVVRSNDMDASWSGVTTAAPVVMSTIAHNLEAETENEIIQVPSDPIYNDVVCLGSIVQSPYNMASLPSSPQSQTTDPTSQASSPNLVPTANDGSMSPTIEIPQILSSNSGEKSVGDGAVVSNRADERMNEMIGNSKSLDSADVDDVSHDDDHSTGSEQTPRRVLQMN
jgi:hypothetical protein